MHIVEYHNSFASFKLKQGNEKLLGWKAIQ